LTAISYRFMGRPWEQELTPSVGSLDSLGANIWICGRLGRVARIVPRDNVEIENGLLDDVTRFSWECVDDPRREQKAVIRTDDEVKRVSRYAGEEEAARRLESCLADFGEDSVGVIAGGGLNTEEYLALKLFCGNVLNTKYYHLGDQLFGNGTPDLAACHSLLHDYTSVDNILAASTVLTLGCDLFDEAPSLGLRLDVAARRGQVKLLSARSFGSDIDKGASLFLDYGYGNLLRVVRGLTNALTGTGEIPDQVQELARQLGNAGEDCAILYGNEVWSSENPLELIHALSALKQAIAQSNSTGCQVYLNAVFPEVNSAGALAVHHLESWSGESIGNIPRSVGSLKQTLEAVANGDVKTLLVFDADLLMQFPDRDLVERAFRSALTVIYCGPFTTATAERATHQLPLGTWMHREGTVANFEYRIQKRHRAVLDTEGPSVLDVVNSLASLLGADQVADSISDLSVMLGKLVPGWPSESLQDFPEAGVKAKLLCLSSESAKPVHDLPAEMKGSVEKPFIVVPKRFLYSDRPEIKFSRVFDRVTKPFDAYLSPVDLKVHNLEPGENALLSGDTGQLELTIRPAEWVRPGSVVINNYCIESPANRLTGAEPCRVAINHKVTTSGS
jgi:NADH dehydrogenase/NADH:ubiquinone oxidoreductase subunit G